MLSFSNSFTQQQTNKKYGLFAQLIAIALYSKLVASNSIWFCLFGFSARLDLKEQTSCIENICFCSLLKILRRNMSLGCDTTYVVTYFERFGHKLPFENQLMWKMGHF